jgi:uncharacterized protein with HEPN domain
VLVSANERLLAHIVPDIDTIATFTSSAMNRANAFSSKKNVEASLRPLEVYGIFLVSTKEECRKRLCLML